MENDGNGLPKIRKSARNLGRIDIAQAYAKEEFF
jgi:hypothetical protein